MFSSDIVDCINQMVNDILWVRSLENSEKKVMVVTLALEVAKDRERWKNERRHLHFMFHSPNNYVLVGSQVSDHFSNIPDQSTWRYHSYHDSCWRLDGTNTVLLNEYIDMCKTAFPEIASNKLDATARIHSIKFFEVSAVKFDRGESIHLEFRPSGPNSHSITFQFEKAGWVAFSFYIHRLSNIGCLTQLSIENVVINRYKTGRPQAAPFYFRLSKFNFALACV